MLKQKLILSYSSKIIVQFIQIVASIIVARIAGPTVLGIVAFALAYVSMFTFLADLGIGTAHIKLVSEGENLGKCITTYSILKSIYICLFIIIVISSIIFQKYFINNNFESKTHEIVLYIILIKIALEQFLFIPNTTFAAKTEQAKQDIPNFIKSIILQILRIIVVVLGYGAIALAYSNLVATILIIPVILIMFKNYPFSKFDKKLAKRYLKISLPVIIIGFSTNLIHTIDKVLLQYYSSSEQVGYYVAGYKIGGFVLMIGTSIGLLFFPLFSKAFAKSDLKYIKEKIYKFERFNFLFIMPFVIVIAITSDLFIKIILGEQYLHSVDVLAIITIAMFILVINMPFGNVITGAGDFKLAAIINILNLILFVSISLIFLNSNIFNCGYIGIAFAVLFSNIFIGILYKYYAKKKCPLLSYKSGLKFFIFGLISFLIFNYIYKYFIYNVLYLKVISIFIFIFVIYFSYYLLRWINKDDLKYLLTLINIKAMFKYINNEIKGNN